MELTYRKEKDYFIPDVALAGNDNNYQIGKYGNLRLDYLKNHKKGLYTELILDCKLPEHLVTIDTQAINRVKVIIIKLAKEQNVTEELKQNNQIEWIKLMNNIKNSAEEIVLNELIYV